MRDPPPLPAGRSDPLAPVPAKPGVMVPGAPPTTLRAPPVAAVGGVLPEPALDAVLPPPPRTGTALWASGVLELGAQPATTIHCAATQHHICRVITSLPAFRRGRRVIPLGTRLEHRLLVTIERQPRT
jgi:hypothetical protein